MSPGWHDGEPGRDWPALARAAAARPPLRPREPLHLEVDGRRVLVGSIEAELGARLAAAGLPLRSVPSTHGAPSAGAGRAAPGAATRAWYVEAPAETSLAAIAAWLRGAGLAGGWRDELLAVVDPGERAVAAIERGVVRVLGLTTFAVHLVGRSFDGSGMWVQQRAFGKATDPGKWDTLMGGQVAAGETTESALKRETWEEAGLELAALLDLRGGERITFRRPVDEGYLVEHIAVYQARLPAGAEPRNQDGEVARFECLDAGSLEARLGRGEFTLEATLILDRTRPRSPPA